VPISSHTENPFELFQPPERLLHSPYSNTLLLKYFSSVHDRLSRLDLQQMVQSLLGDSASSLCDSISGHFHVGFIAPPSTSVSQVTVTAERAGFKRVSVFKSEVVSRELGDLLGKKSVPTTIVKAYDCSRASSHIGIETFLPDAPPLSHSEWYRNNVCLHLGIGLKTSAAVWQALEVCSEGGFYPPTFLRGKPAVNRSEEMLLVYADGNLSGRTFRLEFYCENAEVAE